MTVGLLLDLREGYSRRNQRRLANKALLARRNFSKARDLKLSTRGARFPFRTAIPISDIGISSAIAQATTEATLRLTADDASSRHPPRTPPWRPRARAALSPARVRSRMRLDQGPIENMQPGLINKYISYGIWCPSIGQGWRAGLGAMQTLKPNRNPYEP
jgi:hypothetical protein